MNLDETQLTAVFGAASSGSTLAQRARTSDRMFVRSQMQLAVATPRATGRELNAREVLDSFGIDALVEVAADGRSVIAPDPDEPARTIGLRRSDIGISTTTLASLAKVTEEEVVRAETFGEVSSIHVLQRIAEALALDDQKLSAEPGAGGDPRLGKKSRDMGGTTEPDERMAAVLSEAACVIRRQSDLQDSFDDGRAASLRARFASGSDHHSYRVAERGYMLASRTRRLVGLDDDEPIRSVRSFAEEVLGLPVVQVDLGDTVVGATISNNGARGIALSDRLASPRRSLFRRMTLAHELGHLLWDPVDHLLSVQVDGSSEIEPHSEGGVEEARANAFAVALLAPTMTVRRILGSSQSPSQALLEIVRRYGISAPAARFHLSNVGRMRVDDIRLPKTISGAQTLWHEAEIGSPDAMPVPSDVPPLRAGRFAQLVLRAVEERFVSEDTGASWLRCSRGALQDILATRPPLPHARRHAVASKHPVAPPQRVAETARDGSRRDAGDEKGAG